MKHIHMRMTFHTSGQGRGDAARDPQQPTQPDPQRNDRAPGRFNVLLTQDRAHANEHWTNQLPRLLEPQGIFTHIARSGREAIELAEQLPLHAAVVDLATPRTASTNPGMTQSTPSNPTAGPSADSTQAGLWLLELLNRLPRKPPLVVLRSPATSKRDAERLLGDALRLGAFSVLEKPVGINELLVVFQRLIERRYQGAWPSDPGQSP